jgi:hypothetical protein
MSNYTVMIPSATPGAALSSPPYSSLDNALRGARFLLANGSAAAWIVDAQGRVVLPAEQVKLRLVSLEASTGLPVQSADDAPWFQIFRPSPRRGAPANSFWPDC